MTEPVYNSLIENLTQDLKPVRPLAHPVVRILPWVFLTLMYITVAGFIHGYRTDISEKLQEYPFVFEVGLALFIALSAAFASAWLSIPDARGRSGLTAVPLAGLFVFCALFVFRLVTETYDYSYFSLAHCLGSGVLMGLIPGAFLCFMMKKGATTRPHMMSLMNILAVGFAGYIGLRLTCPLDSAMDGTFHHLLPFIIGGLGFGALAQKIYRW
jgi:hypothetical protein